MAKGDSRRPNRPSPRSSTADKPANGPEAPGSAGPRPARAPQRPSQHLQQQPLAPPLTSRTTTLDDPLTTSLLAEIARRPSTVEMSPAQLAEARAMAPGAQNPEDPEDRDPDDPA